MNRKALKLVQETDSFLTNDMPCRISGLVGCIVFSGGDNTLLFDGFPRRCSLYRRELIYTPPFVQLLVNSGSLPHKAILGFSCTLIHQVHLFYFEYMIRNIARKHGWGRPGFEKEFGRPLRQIGGQANQFGDATHKALQFAFDDRNNQNV
jgi:hypothetical protein